MLTLGVFGFGGGCDQLTNASEELCGPCGDITKGDTFISGDARIDGLFTAVGTLGKATADIDASFKADVMALGEVFGSAITADMDIATMVATVKADIEAEFAANLSGGISVAVVPPKCEASVNVAVEAQANCEAKAGCEVSAECTGGELSVSCEGQCSGTCSGGCTGKCSLEVSGTCEGTCKGSCDMSASPGVCEGTCKGDCTAGCELTAADGTCAGKCSGTCSGTCEPPSVGMTCSGGCQGKCEVDAAGSCEGSCEGSCDAECSGSCQGTATPPSCSAEGSCEASADCQASASAEASASVECTPPSIDIQYNFAAGVDATAQAAFVAKMTEFKARMITVVQGMFKLRALIDADYAAEIGITSPVDAIAGQVDVLINADLGSFDIPAGRLACVLPALETSFEVLGSAGTDLVATVDAQFSLVGTIGM